MTVLNDCLLKINFNILSKGGFPNRFAIGQLSQASVIPNDDGDHPYEFLIG